MPSPIGHIAVGMSAARIHLWRPPSPQATALAMALYSAVSLAPDLDVLAFSFGVPYSAPFGHRGAAHSLAAALAIGLLALPVGRLAGTGVAHRRDRAALLLCAVRVRALASSVTGAAQRCKELSRQEAPTIVRSLSAAA